jgi:hypothetical protein
MSRHEGLEPSDRSLGVVEASDRAPIRRVVSHDIESVKHLTLLDEAALGEWPIGDDAFDARANLDASIRRDLADELVALWDARWRYCDDADLRRR